MGSQETNIFITVLTTCFLFASVFLYFSRSLLHQYRRNLELQRQNSIAAVSALEKERSRISKDLHDDVGPILYLVRKLITQLELSNHDDTLIRQQAVDSLDDTSDRLKEIALDLMPVGLRRGLIQALSDLVTSLSNSYALEIMFVPPSSLQIPDSKSVNIYRIIHEVFHNAIKHSRATRIELVLENKENLLVIQIADNGIGLDYDQALKESKGFGLRNIQNRMEMMRGQVFHQSKKGKGLSYVFEIPMD